MNRRDDTVDIMSRKVRMHRKAQSASAELLCIRTLDCSRRLTKALERLLAMQWRGVM